MVARGFFEHTTPDGITMVDRILATRYVAAATAGRSARTSPGAPARWPRRGAIMKAWMDSPGHRANVLKSAYREIGIGVVTGVPSDARAAPPTRPTSASAR